MPLARATAAASRKRSYAPDGDAVPRRAAHTRVCFKCDAPVPRDQGATDPDTGAVACQRCQTGDCDACFVDLVFAVERPVRVLGRFFHRGCARGIFEDVLASNDADLAAALDADSDSEAPADSDSEAPPPLSPPPCAPLPTNTGGWHEMAILVTLASDVCAGDETKIVVLAAALLAVWGRQMEAALLIGDVRRPGMVAAVLGKYSDFPDVTVFVLPSALPYGTDWLARPENAAARRQVAETRGGWTAWIANRAWALALQHGLESASNAPDVAVAGLTATRLAMRGTVAMLGQQNLAIA